MEKTDGMVEATICFPIKDQKVLLGIKAEKIGKNLWNGYGGIIERHETPEGAAVRELFEEAHISTPINRLKKAAVVDFYNHTVDGESFTCRCHVFLTRHFIGVPEATAEMHSPTWYAFNCLPLSAMMPADPGWVPHVLHGRTLYVRAWYGPGQKTILKPVELYDLALD